MIYWVCHASVYLLHTLPIGTTLLYVPFLRVAGIIVKYLKISQIKRPYILVAIRRVKYFQNFPLFRVKRLIDCLFNEVSILYGFIKVSILQYIVYWSFSTELAVTSHLTTFLCGPLGAFAFGCCHFMDLINWHSWGSQCMQDVRQIVASLSLRVLYHLSLGHFVHSLSLSLKNFVDLLLFVGV